MADNELPRRRRPDGPFRPDVPLDGSRINDLRNRTPGDRHRELQRLGFIRGMDTRTAPPMGPTTPGQNRRRPGSAGPFEGTREHLLLSKVGYNKQSPGRAGKVSNRGIWNRNMWRGHPWRRKRWNEPTPEEKIAIQARIHERALRPFNVPAHPIRLGPQVPIDPIPRKNRVGDRPRAVRPGGIVQPTNRRL